MFVETGANAIRRPIGEFWETLNRGQYQAAEYKRIAKGGREIWIQASYNPILDLNGKPFKVVKYATDITAQAMARKKAESARGLIEIGRGRQRGDERLDPRNLGNDDQVQGDRGDGNRTGRGRGSSRRKSSTSAAQAMGGIVELIGNITGQINLLALNATIEFGPRRRGRPRLCRRRLRGQESGQPGQARHRHDLEGNRSRSTASPATSCGSLTAIKTAIADVNEFITSTAAAVEEQSIVTEDMSSNMQRASAELA